MKSDGANTKVTSGEQTAINTKYEMFNLALSVLSILNLVVEILPFAQDVKDLVTIVDVAPGLHRGSIRSSTVCCAFPGTFLR